MAGFHEPSALSRHQASEFCAQKKRPRTRLPPFINFLFRHHTSLCIILVLLLFTPTNKKHPHVLSYYHVQFHHKNAKKTFQNNACFLIPCLLLFFFFPWTPSTSLFQRSDCFFIFHAPIFLSYCFIIMLLLIIVLPLPGFFL